MKKVLLVSLLLALVMSLLLPAAAMAASPASGTFGAQGYLTGIDTGNVKPLGNSGKWLVRDRTITGQFVGGDLGSTAFTLTYDGVFELTTQEGNLVGTLSTGNSALLVTGQVAPLSFVSAPVPGGYLPVLTITGHWVGISGVKANGSFQAYMVFVPTADGHVDYIIDSGFMMTGKYNGKR